MINLLNIPAAHFGNAGIELANFVHTIVKAKDPHCKIEYDSNQRFIVIKSLAEVAFKQLAGTFNEIRKNPKFCHYYPAIESKDTDGNIFVSFNTQISGSSEPWLLP